jgi:hypothetical protein
MKNRVKTLIAALIASSTVLPIYSANKDLPQGQDSHPEMRKDSGVMGQRISFGEVPQAAKKTILQHTGGMTPKDVRSIKENGTQCYSATFDQGRTKGRVIVASDGSLLSLRESAVFAADVENLPSVQKSQINFNQLPEPVQQRIRHEAGTARVGNLSLTDVDGQRLYRAAFDRGGVLHELFITPQGAIAAQVQATTVASNVRIDENGNIVATQGKQINEAAGGQPKGEGEK